VVFVVEKVTRVEDFHRVLLFYILSSLPSNLLVYVCFYQKEKWSKPGKLKNAFTVIKKYRIEKTGIFYPPKN